VFFSEAGTKDLCFAIDLVSCSSSITASSRTNDGSYNWRLN
jgi:hypothetical protein